LICSGENVTRRLASVFDRQSTMVVDARGQIREAGIDLESGPIPPAVAVTIAAGTTATSAGRPATFPRPIAKV